MTLVAAPRAAAEWQEGPAEQRAQAAKAAAVAAAELEKLRAASGAASGPLLAWLWAPVVESLQLELENVHVRFEDAPPAIWTC